MSPAQKFLQQVERTGMVSEPLLAELRKRVAETHRNMRPEMLAKLLVDRGELTAAQARKLVAITVEGSPEPPPPPSPPVPTEPMELDLAEENPLAFLDDEKEDEYALRPLEEDQGTPGELEVAELDLAEEEEELPEALLADDAEDLLADVPPTPPPSATASPASVPPAKEAPPPAAQRPNSELPEEDVLGDSLLHERTAESRRLPRRRRGLAGFIAELWQPKRPRKNRWDSPLILLGGGALILMVAAGFGFFALFYSENAEEVFNAGQDAYASQSYALAIESFSRLDDRFPGHEKASLARVRIQLAKLRQIIEGTQNWERALDQAANNLPQVQQEAAFDEVRGELAKLLPDITAGLVDLAAAAESVDEQERLLNRAMAARELVDNPEYLPTSVRKTQEQRIAAIDERISVVRRTILRDRQLAKTLAEIKTAAETGQITTAYQLRDKLLAQFPILADHSALIDTLRLVAAKEQQAVAVEDSRLQAFAEDHRPTVDLTVVLSDQRGSPLEQHPAEDMICIQANAAAYGLQTATGEVRWRRFVGFDTHVFPQQVGTELGSDFLLVDAHHSELQRVKADTGELVWRLPCPRPLYTPRILGDRVLLVCGNEGDSRLLSLDLTNGTPTREVRFPVGCIQSPAIGPGGSQLIQLGTHSSIYVLDSATLTARQVISLGHQRASVITDPTMVGDSLVIVVNRSSDAAEVHAFSQVDDGNWIEAQTPQTLRGNVISNPVVHEQRILIATDLGEVHVLEATVDQAGLRPVARIPGSGSVLGPTFAILDRSDIWIANQTFGRYELQATRAAIVTRWVRDRNDRFLQPLVRRGGTLIHVRHRLGMLGTTVSAIQRNRDDRQGTPVWQTDLGVPSDITVNSAGAVHTTTANGAMFPITGAAVRAGVTNQATSRIDARLLPQALAQRVELTTDVRLLASPPPIEQFFLSDQLRGELRRVPIRLGSDVVTTELVAFQDGVLAACATGPIYFLGANDGEPRSSPFLPRIEPGTRIDWLVPAASGSGQFMAAEKSGRLYLVQVGEDQMRLLREQYVDEEISHGLVSLGEVVYAVMPAVNGDRVVPINPTDLSLGQATALDGAVTWGPQRVGRLVFVVDEHGMAYAFGEKGQLLWKGSQSLGALAGTPLPLENGFAFASADGTVWRVDEQGEVVAQLAVGEPLGSGPVAFNGRLLIAGWDGTLYLVNLPQP